MKTKEIFKNVENYDGLYQVSNLGRVKSLYNGGRILKATISNNYLQVGFFKLKVQKKRKVHQLVAEAFLGHKTDGTTKLVVDHIDNNKLNNNLNNLQIISHRENISKDIMVKTSKYTGVCFDKKSKKWRSQIMNNRIKEHLGFYVNEIEASRAYQNRLKEINFLENFEVLPYECESAGNHLKLINKY